MINSLNIRKFRLIVYLIHTQVKITRCTYTQKSVVSNWMFYVMCEKLLLITVENRTQDDANKRQREKLIAQSVLLSRFLSKIVKELEHSVK